MKRRNTKQMNVILDIMKNDRSHPTIQELCEKVMTVDSSIGQATVYRNVSKLCEEGILTKISVGIDHYDYIKNPHYHLYCYKCLKLYDVFDESYFDKSLIEKKHNVKIDSSSVLFYGVCSNCLSDEK